MKHLETSSPNEVCSSHLDRDMGVVVDISHDFLLCGLILSFVYSTLCILVHCDIFLRVRLSVLWHDGNTFDQECKNSVFNCHYAD